MVRRDNNGGWILITQNDHSVLSGLIMEHWGNEAFAKPDPYEEVLFAIKNHDLGWKDWDSKPKINPENGYPANFTEMSPFDQSVIWSKCFRSHSSDHSYASALIALHFLKFNNSNLRKDPYNKHLKLLQLDIRDFISKELDFIITENDLGEIPEQVSANLKLLQIGDIISLTFCHGWRSIEITEAPVDYEGSETTLVMESQDGFNYTISPYPFNRDLLKLHIAAKHLKRKIFSNNVELREAIDNSDNLKLDFTLRKS